MASLALKRGMTGTAIRVFIQDTTRTDGGGLTGLVYNTAGLTAYYAREGDGSGRVTLAPAGLDAVSVADVASDADARSTFTKMMRAVFNRLYNNVTQTSSTQIVQNDGGSTVSTMAVSGDGTTATKGKRS